MREPKQESLPLAAPADAVFQAALGVLQNNKRATLYAVHNSGRLLAARQKGAMSNPKFVQVRVEGDTASSVLHVVIGTDPRSTEAILDSRANQKALATFVQDVQGALDGSKPAPVTPVPDHFMQKKTQVPWSDAEQDPAIELGGNFKAMFNL